MIIQPTGDLVLVKEREAEAVTSFGLVLTEKQNKRPEGTVIAVGPGKLLENGTRGEMQVKVGDYVLLRAWGGETVELGEGKHQIIPQSDILAIVYE